MGRARPEPTDPRSAHATGRSGAATPARWGVAGVGRSSSRLPRGRHCLAGRLGDSDRPQPRMTHVVGVDVLLKHGTRFIPWVSIPPFVPTGSSPPSRVRISQVSASSSSTAHASDGRSGGATSSIRIQRDGRVNDIVRRAGGRTLSQRRRQLHRRIEFCALGEMVASAPERCEALLEEGVVWAQRRQLHRDIDQMRDNSCVRCINRLSVGR